MKRKQKYRLSILLSLMSLFLFMFGLKQIYSPHTYKETEEHYRNSSSK